jgi:hypothetical protein
MSTEDRAIWNRARRIVNEEIDASQLVRNSVYPTAYRWLSFVETWADGRAAVSRSVPAPVHDDSVGTQRT